MEMISAWLIQLIPFVSGAMVSAIGFFVIRQSRKRSTTMEILRGDDLLIGTAIQEVAQDAPKVTYLEVTVKMELKRLTELYTKSNKYRVLLGSVYLVTGFISIAITGTNASLPGFLDTVKFSFAVNIIGEIASGFLIFGGFEGKAETAYQSASLIRLELGQFIAQSAEYFQQPANIRWFLMTQSVETILLRSISMNTIKKVEKEGNDDGDGDETEQPAAPTVMIQDADWHIPPDASEE